MNAQCCVGGGRIAGLRSAQELTQQKQKKQGAAVAALPRLPTENGFKNKIVCAG
jgi:hypothetical protein